MLDVEKIEALRGKLGLTQDQAASKAGLVSKTHWNDIVKGRKSPSLETLDRIANALGVKAKELLL